MANASCSSSVQSPLQHQVFINFRGKELRNGFLSFLELFLKRDGINVYIDKNETKGNELNIFFSRIEKSRIALAIFSSQYTESKWCLDELVKIKECVDLRKLVVIPIFYKVETDDVKNLEGVFGDNFWKWAKTHNGETIDKWREALKAVPEKIGFTLVENSDEGEIVDKIVREVIKVLSDIPTDLERETPIDHPSAVEEEIHIDKLSKGEGEYPVVAPGSHPRFGMNMRLKQLEEKFNSASERTFTIGVVGMAGFGKTTLMEMLYENKGYLDFLQCAFIQDIHKRCKYGMLDRSTLTKELLKDKNLNQEVTDMSPQTLKALLLSRKSLVVLDDVSDKKQIEVFLGECDWIKKGSLIFITTRDMSVIEGKVDDTYEVLRLSGRDSFQCFNYFSFGKVCTPKGIFMNLSREFADYAKGNPLALKILGGELNGKDETHWKEKLCELAKCPNEKIQGVLQISYDQLGHHQKDVFLDIACFFRSGDEYYVRSLVESCDIESVDAMSVIKDLSSKFLINISGGRVEMHDLLHTFGKKLSSQGSCRLWNHELIVDELRKQAGAGVRGIFFDMSELEKKLGLDMCTFTEMRNLRYLKFYCSRCHQDCEAACKLKFPDGLEFSLDEIRYLYWLKFPLKKLPKDFNPKYLTDLNLPYSEIEEVWEGVKDTPKLKWVDLSHSSKLCNLSGLVNAEILQRLNLEGCTSLTELPDGMERMKSLIFLNMRGCTSLRFLPQMNLISMKTLILTNCSGLQQFQVISDHLETLHLDGTAITQLPTNMGKLQRLIVLNLKDCKKLGAVPECLGKLKALQELVLSGCSELKSFPIPIENMKCLQILLLDGTAIKETPKILNSSKVEDLHGELRHGVSGLSSLRRLCLSKNDMISNLQIDISQLYHLKWLDLKYCKNLRSIPLLPPNLEILDAHGCEKLKTVASPMARLIHMEQVHSKLIFTNCSNLEQVAMNSITSYAQRKSQQEALRSYKEGTVSEALLITSFPGSEVPSWFNHRRIGSTLVLKLPPHWCNNRFSTIVLCAVVAFPHTDDEVNCFSIECTCEFKSELGTCTRFSCNLGGGWVEPRKISLDHVFIGYISSSHVTKHLDGLSQPGDYNKYVPTETSIEFKVGDGADDIVNCGFSLVYEEPKYVAIEGNCNGTSSRRDVSFG